MPKIRPPYAPEFRQQMVDLVRAGRDAQDLAHEFEPSAQAIRSWVAEADCRDGRRDPKPAATDATLMPAERDELARLRRECVFDQRTRRRQRPRAGLRGM